jgi:hypothetical protein
MDCTPRAGMKTAAAAAISTMCWKNLRTMEDYPMTFTFEGEHYRIGFQHDRPRDWPAHVGHALTLVAPEGKSAVLFCERCRTFLSDIGPHMTQKVKPRRGGALPAGVTIGRVMKRYLDRELTRSVRCTIYQRHPMLREATSEDDWLAVYSGLAHLNTDAGDRYEREKGRLMALRNALPKSFHCNTCDEDLAHQPVNGPHLGHQVTHLPDPLDRRLRFNHTAIQAYILRPRAMTGKAGGL